jgi:hypothetical protein
MPIFQFAYLLQNVIAYQNWIRTGRVPYSEILKNIYNQNKKFWNMSRSWCCLLCFHVYVFMTVFPFKIKIWAIVYSLIMALLIRWLTNELFRCFLVEISKGMTWQNEKSSFLFQIEKNSNPLNIIKKIELGHDQLLKICLLEKSARHDFIIARSTAFEQ